MQDDMSGTVAKKRGEGEEQEPVRAGKWVEQGWRSFFLSPARLKWMRVELHTYLNLEGKETRSTAMHRDVCFVQASCVG
jgi:hypothetical protein